MPDNFLFNGKNYTREDLEEMDFDDLEELYLELNNLYIQEDSFVYTRQVAYKNGVDFPYEELLKKKGFLAFLAKFKGEVLLILKRKRRSESEAFVKAAQELLDADTLDNLWDEVERIIGRSTYYE